MLIVKYGKRLGGDRGKQKKIKKMQCPFLIATTNVSIVLIPWGYYNILPFYELYFSSLSFYVYY